MTYPEQVLDASLLFEITPSVVKQKASTTRRFFNFVIDYFIGGTILGILVGSFLGLVLTLLKLQHWIAAYQYSTPAKLVMSVLVLIAYYTFCEYTFQGKTLGKLITRTRVVSLDDQPLKLGQVFRRSFARFIPFETVSFILGHRSCEGWHDRLSKTMVVVD